MTDIEISKALALAIGWKYVWDFGGILLVDFHPSDRLRVGSKWRDGREFDYRDWNVIGPIAAKYNAFPVQFDGNPLWYSNTWTGTRLHEEYADTPQKAIAMAVIGAHVAT